MAFKKRLLLFFIYIGIPLLFSSYVAFINLTSYSQEDKDSIGLMREEQVETWVNGGSPYGGIGIVKSVFGSKEIIFSLHCWQTAQSYYHTVIGWTVGAILFFTIILFMLSSIIVWIFHWELTYKQRIYIAIGIGIGAYLFFQIFYMYYDGFEDTRITHALRPVCF